MNNFTDNIYFRVCTKLQEHYWEFDWLCRSLVKCDSRTGYTRCLWCRTPIHAQDYNGSKICCKLFDTGYKSGSLQAPWSPGLTASNGYMICLVGCTDQHFGDLIQLYLHMKGAHGTTCPHLLEWFSIDSSAIRAWHRRHQSRAEINANLRFEYARAKFYKVPFESPPWTAARVQSLAQRSGVYDPFSPNNMVLIVKEVLEYGCTFSGYNRKSYILYNPRCLMACICFEDCNSNTRR